MLPPFFHKDFVSKKFQRNRALQDFAQQNLILLKIKKFSFFVLFFNFQEGFIPIL